MCYIVDMTVIVTFYLVCVKTNLELWFDNSFEEF